MSMSMSIVDLYIARNRKAPNALMVNKVDQLAAMLRWFTAGGAIRIALRQLSKTWKLRHYDVIDDVIIWVQDGNCKKTAGENFSIRALYNITNNQHNPIKTVVRDSFLSPKTPKNTSF